MLYIQENECYENKGHVVNSYNNSSNMYTISNYRYGIVYFTINNMN